MRFPDVHDPQSEAKTKQILSEIDRINQQLGYVKKQPRVPSSAITRPPVESYFFPRDRRHYAPSSSSKLTPSQNQNYLIIPFPYQFYVPSPSLESPSEREGRKFGHSLGQIDFFRNMFSASNHVQDSKQFQDSDSIEPPLITFPHESLRNNFSISLPPTTTTTTPKPKNKDPDLIDAIIDEVIDDDEDNTSEDEEEDDDVDDDSSDDEEEQKDKKKKVPGEYQNISINKYINNLYKNSLVAPKVSPSPNRTTTFLNPVGSSSNVNTQFASTTEHTRIFNPLKRIKDFTKRKQQPQQQQPDKESVISTSGEKSPFGLFRPAETALKEGGIVIQRLRVRQGGIAIAGAGGVATAGKKKQHY